MCAKVRGYYHFPSRVDFSEVWKPKARSKGRACARTKSNNAFPAEPFTLAAKFRASLEGHFSQAIAAVERANVINCICDCVMNEGENSQLTGRSNILDSSPGDEPGVVLQWQDTSQSGVKSSQEIDDKFKLINKT